MGWLFFDSFFHLRVVVWRSGHIKDSEGDEDLSTSHSSRSKQGVESRFDADVDGNKGETGPR